jgi:hypothetical protein
LTALQDFVTICLDKNGNQIWVSRYNYNNSYDIATSIVYNTTTSYVEVTGPSGTTYTDWDIATVAYKSTSGSQQWVNRTANPGENEDKAYSMATDTLGNVYIKEQLNSFALDVLDYFNLVGPGRSAFLAHQKQLFLLVERNIKQF